MKKKEYIELIEIICEFLKKQNTGGDFDLKESKKNFLEGELIKICVPGEILGKRFSRNPFLEVHINYEERGGTLRCYTSSIQFLTLQEKENLIQHLIAQVI